MVLADQVGDVLDIETGVEQSLEILFEEVSVRGQAGLDLQAEILVERGILGDERLHVAAVGPPSEELVGRVGDPGEVVPPRRVVVRAVGDDRQAAAEDVARAVEEAVNIVEAGISSQERGRGLLVLVVGVADVIKKVAAEVADLRPQRDPLAGGLVSGAQIVDVEVPDVDFRWVADVEQIEEVEVGSELLAEVIVGGERDALERRG